MVIDQARPFPLILDKTLNIGLLLMGKQDHEQVFATIQVPSVLPRIVPVPTEKGSVHMLLEDLIKPKLSDFLVAMRSYIVAVIESRRMQRCTLMKKTLKIY